MAKELTEEQKLRRKKRSEERRRQKKAEFDRTEQRLKRTYTGKNIKHTDLELINYPFYTTSYNHEVKVDVGDDDIIKSVKLTRM
jgi:hypothetical protein